MENKTWLETYLKNYNGKSNEAKEIIDFVNQTFNGADYVPWATMERLTYMQDPEARFTTILTPEGGMVWTDMFTNTNKTIAKDGARVETEAIVVSHFVKVECVFLGKTFVEEYPIQDPDYSAAKIYNQNLVNKALKRAMAKVASRATGLGLKLYEKKDLQFEDTTETKPEVKKTTKSKKAEVEPTPIAVEVQDTKVQNNVSNVKQEVPVQEVVTEPTTSEDTNVETVTVEVSSDVYDLIQLIKTADKDKITKVLQSLNVAILKQHGFILSVDDSEADLGEKLSKFQDVKVFTKAIKNMIGE